MRIKGRKIILSEKDNISQETFDKVLRKFKKLTRKLGIIKEIRDRRYFEKPSSKKRKVRLARQHKRS